MVKTQFFNHLPHLLPIGSTFFVTTRLADSLPKELVKSWQKEIASILENLREEKMSIDEIRTKETELRRSLFGKYEQYLDFNPRGSCILQIPAVRSIVAEEVQRLSPAIFQPLAFCIMPNHLHLLLDFGIQLDDERPEQYDFGYIQLHEALRLIKGRSARRINLLLGKRGSLWQHESFDRYVRNDRELLKTLSYILNNPVKAKLVADWQDWPGTFLSPLMVALL